SAKHLIAIYGENGSGKTNIVDAFRILKFSTLTTFFSETFTNFQSSLADELPDADRISKLEGIKELYIAMKFRDINSLLENTPRINSKEDTTLIYNFSIDGLKGSYEISYDNNCKLKSESLYYLVNKNRGNLFSIENHGKGIELEINLNKMIFKTSSLRNELKDSILKLWGKHTFLSIFKQFQNHINESYVIDNVSANFLSVLNEFEKIVIWTDEVKGPFIHHKTFLSDLESGTIDREDLYKLEKCEEVIFSYFSSLYADIKNIKYKVKENESKIDYQLYVVKNISGEAIEIPFYLESNGTKNLLELLQVFFSAINGNIVIVDEIDQGIHDILMNNIIRNVSESLSGQLIFTTHDTFLLQELPPS
ncbi:ATP-binding protein, partial [Enterococcus faecalis]|nr:ATP-binding protein [Enterococcus faecalis]